MGLFSRKPATIEPGIAELPLAAISLDEAKATLGVSSDELLPEADTLARVRLDGCPELRGYHAAAMRRNADRSVSILAGGEVIATVKPADTAKVLGILQARGGADIVCVLTGSSHAYVSIEL